MKIFPQSRLIVLGLLLALLSACASQTPRPITPLDNVHQLTHWRLKGKLGITVPNDRINAFIDWQQNQDAFHIKLNGPFGQGLTKIDGDHQGLTLTSGDDTITGPDAESVMLNQLGWSVPVQHFSYWAKGIPSPLAAITAEEYDESGSLSVLVQDGWQLQLSRYEAVAGVQLPGKMIARAPELSLVLVIKDWQPR